MLPLGVVYVLLRSIEDMQSCFHSAYQLIPVVLPHRPFLRVPGQPCLQLVHPEGHNKTPIQYKKLSMTKVCYTILLQALKRSAVVSTDERFSPLTSAG